MAKGGRHEARVIEVRLELLPWQGGHRYRVFAVSGALLGFMEKLEAKPGEEHPWKCFRPKFVAGKCAEFGEMIGAFYHGYHGAIGALVAAEYGLAAKAKVVA